MTLDIRRAGPADAAGLTACIDAAYAGYREQGFDLPPVSEGVAEDIAEAHVWVAWDGDAIAGGLILSIENGEAYLKNVAVHPDHGGRGIGRQLMQAAEEAAIAVGCAVMKLTTHAEMPWNVAMYERLGWKVTRREGQKMAMERRLPNP